MPLLIEDPVTIAKLTPALVADRALWVDAAGKLVEAGSVEAHQQVASRAGKLIPEYTVHALGLSLNEDGDVVQVEDAPEPKERDAGGNKERRDGDTKDRDALKARAVELGLTHAKNISTDKLAQMVAAVEDAPEPGAGGDEEE